MLSAVEPKQSLLRSSDFHQKVGYAAQRTKGLSLSVNSKPACQLFMESWTRNISIFLKKDDACLLFLMQNGHQYMESETAVPIQSHIYDKASGSSVLHNKTWTLIGTLSMMATSRPLGIVLAPTERCE
jgi:hypothetical protein